VVWRHVRVRFRPELSTVQATPDWPIMLANLVAWRSAALPGAERPNVRLGEQAAVTLPGYRETVKLTTPGGQSREVPVKGRTLAWQANEPGVWTVGEGEEVYSVSANVLDANESDMRKAETGRWGDWLDETTLRMEYRGASWLLLLLLLAVACVHLVVMRAGREGKVGR
jgi:hypothetical protein